MTYFYHFKLYADHDEDGNDNINIANINGFAVEENQTQATTKIQYMDECGNLVNEEAKNPCKYKDYITVIFFKCVPMWYEVV